MAKRENRRRASLSSASKVVAGQSSWPGATKRREGPVVRVRSFVRYTTPS
jgi:hypothetical protein